jgi:hypothetical protein
LGRDQENQRLFFSEKQGLANDDKDHGAFWKSGANPGKVPEVTIFRCFGRRVYVPRRSRRFIFLGLASGIFSAHQLFSAVAQAITF